MIADCDERVENVSHDLESFAKYAFPLPTPEIYNWLKILVVYRHAGRSTINTDDVLLLARRNDGLGELLKEFIEKEKAEKMGAGSSAKGKGKAKK